MHRPEAAIFCHQADISKVPCCRATAVTALCVSALRAQGSHLGCQAVLLWHRAGMQHKSAGTMS